MQTLTCAHNGHTYQRAPSRGRKPKFCDQHKPQAAASTATSGEMETLFCQHGNHEYQRPRVRGKKPKFCPEHKPVPEIKPKVESETYILHPDKLRSPLVMRVLNGPDTELRRKLAYVVREIENPRPSREPEDFNSLKYTHKRLVQEAGRLFNTTETVVFDDEL